jgi:hypothetical protein
MQEQSVIGNKSTTRTTSKSFRKYLNTIQGKHEIKKELEATI